MESIHKELRQCMKFEEALQLMRDEAIAVRSHEWGETEMWIDSDGDITFSTIRALNLHIDEIMGLWDEVDVDAETRVGYAE